MVYNEKIAQLDIAIEAGQTGLIWERWQEVERICRERLQGIKWTEQGPFPLGDQEAIDRWNARRAADKKEHFEAFWYAQQC